jgi:hypothetical protein
MIRISLTQGLLVLVIQCPVILNAIRGSKAVLAYHAAQTGTRDPQYLAGLAAVPAGGLQDSLHVGLLNLSSRLHCSIGLSIIGTGVHRRLLRSRSGSSSKVRVDPRHRATRFMRIVSNSLTLPGQS